MRINYKEETYFGKVKFIREIEGIVDNKGVRKRLGEFKCFCGNEFVKVIGEVARLNCTSCGCKIQKNLKPEFRGCSRSPEYRVWNNLKNRVTNPKAINFHRYGGRGITFCDKWNTFEGFFNDMGERPSNKHSIDRIDNEKGYYKENCRWATRKEQAYNRSTTIKILYKNNELSLKDFAKKNKINLMTLHNRVKKGLSLVEAINKKQEYNVSIL